MLIPSETAKHHYPSSIKGKEPCTAALLDFTSLWNPDVNTNNNQCQNSCSFPFVFRFKSENKSRRSRKIEQLNMNMLNSVRIINREGDSDFDN